MQKTRRLVWIVMVWLILGLTALAWSKGFTIAVSNGYIGNSWRTQMIAAIEELGEKYKQMGLVDKVIIKNSGLDIQAQIADFRNLMNMQPDAILLNPNSPDALNSVIEEAVSRGILVVAIDQPVTSEEVACNVTINQYEWGKKLAEWLVEKLGGKGKIVRIDGLAGHPANVERVKGMTEVYSKYPEIEIVASANGDWDEARAQQVMSNFIAAYPQIDGVQSQDGMALGVVKAYQAAGIPIPKVTGETIVSFLHEWKSLKEQGDFETIGITNPPGAAGAFGLGFAVRLLQGKKFKPGVLAENKYFYLPVTVVTNENFDRFYESVKDKPDSYFPDYIPTEEELDALFE